MAHDPTEEQRLTAWWETRRAHPTCAACGGNRWTPQHITALPHITTRGGSTTNDSTYLVLVTCDDCGATLLFDIARDMLAHKARERHG
jgi:hypothetical protein